MKNQDREIFNLFTKKVKEQFPKAQIWAYGSRVSEKAGDYSDLDVCVVIDGLDEFIDRKIMRIAWEVGLDQGIIISTVTYSLDEFNSGPCSRSSLVETIRREGAYA